MTQQFGYTVDLTKTFIYVIDSSLGLSKGKIAAQVSHLAIMLSDGKKILGKAVVLKADHEYFEFLCSRPGAIYVHDAGLTEVLAGTRTCVGFIKNGQNIELFKNLKLL